MTEIKNGGFAFPCPADDKSGWSAVYGMTLRDWFASQALTSAMGQYGPDKAAHMAYAYADAMLVRREVAK